MRLQFEEDAAMYFLNIYSDSYGCMKFNKPSSVLYGRRLTMEMKGKIYKTCVGAAEYLWWQKLGIQRQSRKTF